MQHIEVMHPLQGTIVMLDHRYAAGMGHHLATPLLLWPQLLHRAGSAAVRRWRAVTAVVAKAGTEELRAKDKDTTMPELLIDFITSLEGYAAPTAGGVDG